MADAVEVDLRIVLHWLIRTSTIAALLVGAVSCTAFSDFDGLTGLGFAPGQDGGNGGMDVEAECESMMEVCTNGVDDDCDGLPDCEDPQCGAYKCTDRVPDGWIGYVAYFEGAPERVPYCPSSYREIGAAGGRDPAYRPAECSACSCGLPPEELCTRPKIVFFQNTTCSSSTSWPISDLAPGTCNKFTLGGSVPPLSVRIHEPSVSGTCVASGGVPSTQPPWWNTVGRACLSVEAGGGCAENSKCVRRPTSEFNKGVCIFRQGDRTCPPPYVDKSIVYQDFSDSRACSACSCGPPTGSPCLSTVTVSRSRVSNNQCTKIEPDAEVVAQSAGCYAGIDPVFQHYVHHEYKPPSDSACAVHGGQPSGTVEANVYTAVTVCCSPF